MDNYLKAILALSGPEGEQSGQQCAGPAARGCAGLRDEHVAKAGRGRASVLSNTSVIAALLLSPQASDAPWKWCATIVCLRTFLYEILDYPIEEVHEEAERLEHFHLRAIRGAHRGQTWVPEDGPAWALHFPQWTGECPRRIPYR